jgi:uncharacterized oxidoreductase
VSSTEAPGVRVARAPLAELAQRLLSAAGAPAENAHVVVEHLLDADTMGLRSHGVMRIPQYLGDIARGETDPAAAPTVTRLTPGRALIDGNRGFGQVAGLAMAREAVALARGTGVAFVAGRHMGHTGRIGAYAEAIAHAGMVGLAVCSGPRSGHFVAPFGGVDGRLATNPIAFAYPSAEGAPVVADFSTSVAPEGVIRSLMHRGLRVPPGALRDAAGQPTEDPAALYASPRGAIQPLGGEIGYRGTALALLVEVFAALLAGDETDDTTRAGSNLAILALSADEAFIGRAARMGRYVRSSQPIDPARPVLLPGEREQRIAAAAGEVIVDGPTWAALEKAASGCGIPLPASTQA